MVIADQFGSLFNVHILPLAFAIFFFLFSFFMRMTFRINWIVMISIEISAQVGIHLERGGFSMA
jgi:hypothetical protein